ncbi:NAD-dependent epimerase/dehydratase family protein [Microbacterium sp. APC 3898]|uniref:NAD-dependent epimerase/dehydratase family protein n=1 Tax=Planococcus notacanthi TaxID=3035188 RepID=A0ABT7ZET9_9BACL|nr:MULTISPECIES: NAD-dependent epimerase/dehydratase family protein [Terrabacteria group]MDN3425673.1 NAD-dependent epimerase/dehydratase family protein [Planococcus sp. APC 4016]MDN3500949.1 NAD-dependent epimerase/dehydratase family protein [Microbacterium sp. APC 3898]
MSKKRILITGQGSYVGTNFIEWISQWPEMYEVEELSVRGEDWKKKDFSSYDSILHVAGIAHVSTDPKMEEQYYKVNRDLTIEVAEYAKRNDVKQFIFMSSIIVYGDSNSDKTVIDRNTVPKPSNFYGNSKLQAEEGLKLLESKDFKVAVVRPPMIYGKNSKGNYPKLAKAAKILPVFPDYENQRSMLHIDNLNEFLRLMVENEERGIFFPQNKEYVKTTEMVRIIAGVHGRKIMFTKIFNSFLKLLVGKLKVVNKVFGNFVYEKNMSEYKKNYEIRKFNESIKVTESRES